MAKFKLEFELPVMTQLKLKRDDVNAAGGKALAKAIRKNIRSGKDASGKPLPSRPGQKGSAPLNNTGKLVRGIKYYPEAERVGPSSRKRRDVSSRARSSFGLMMIHNDTWDRDIMGVTREMNDIINKAAEKEIAKQLNTGEAGIQWHPKKIT